MRAEINFGWSWSCGFSAGLVYTGGAQLGLGLEAGAGFTVTGTTADSVSNLGGSSTYLGVSTPVAGGDFIAAQCYAGLSGNGGPWLPPILGVHAGNLNSGVWQWF